MNPFTQEKTVINVEVIHRDNKDFEQTTFSDGSLIQSLVTKASYQPAIDALTAETAKKTALQNACVS